MIVVISNRNITGRVDGNNKPFSFLGKDLGNSGNIYAKVVSDNKRLSPYSEENKDKLFDSIVTRIKDGDAKLSRPWLFFLHGNNQTTAKNIQKAIDIEKQHNVNVIAFSWPSQPYTGKDDQTLRALKKEAVKRLIIEFGGTNIVSMVLSKGADKAEEFIRNYVQARMNAEASPPDFMHALKVTDNYLMKPLGNKIKMSFLCHSLGNYLLQNTIAGSTFPVKFKNIIMHQADVDAKTHADWARKLLTKADRMYITTNQYDYVLMASYYFNRKERLGQTKQFYGLKKANYVDFSDAAYTSAENEHEFFRQGHKAKGLNYTNEEIHTYLGRAFRSEKPGLSPATGFRRKGDNLFRLAEIIDPIDGDIIPS